MDRFLLGSEPCSIQAGDLAQVPARITVLYTLLVASLMVYFIGAAVYWRRAFLSLREKPYNQMRMAHQHLRLSVRLRGDPGASQIIYAAALQCFVWQGIR